MSNITNTISTASTAFPRAVCVSDNGTVSSITAEQTEIVRGVTVSAVSSGEAPSVVIAGEATICVGSVAVNVNDLLVVEADGMVIPLGTATEGTVVVAQCVRGGIAGGECRARLMLQSVLAPIWTLVGGEYVTLAYNTAGEPQVRVNGGAEMSVGSPEDPAEFVAGEGDSRSEEIVCYTSIGGVWSADVGDTIRAGTGVSVGLAIGDAIYFAADLEVGGSPYQSGGHKINTLTAAAGGTIVCQHYTSGGWVDLDTMATLSGTPYTPYANTPLMRAQSEQVRHNTEAMADAVAHASVDPTDGTSPTYSGARFTTRYIVTATLSAAPVIGVVKYHTSRFEINADGTREMFVRAQARDDLGLHISDFSRGSSLLGNADIDFGPNITVGRTLNDMGSGDNIADARKMPGWVNTASPIEITIDFQMSGTSTVPVEFELFAAVRKAGETVDGTDTSVGTVSVTPTGTAGQRLTAVLSGRIADVIQQNQGYSGDMVALAIERTDANPNNAELIDMGASAVRWRDGYTPV